MISPRAFRQLTSDGMRLIRETNEVVRKTSAAQERIRRAQTKTRRQLAALTAQHAETRQQLLTISDQLATFQGQLQRDITDVRIALALQNEIAHVNTAAFGEYKDAFRGRDVVVVASGPTLTHYEPIDGAVHIGVNSIISEPRIPLDIYFAQDFGGWGGLPGFVAQFDEGKLPGGCKYFFGLSATTPNGLREASESLTARVGASRYYVDNSPTGSIHMDIRFHPLMDFYTVVFPAIHFALFTNPRRIYLVGCDASYFGHFDGAPQPETDAQIREYLTHRLHGYRQVRDFARRFYSETELVSINPVNLAGLFRDEHTAHASFRTSPHQSALAANAFSDEAITEFVERHVAEVRQQTL